MAMPNNALMKSLDAARKNSLMLANNFLPCYNQKVGSSHYLYVLNETFAQMGRLERVE
ncbi:hypothetical protein IJI55_01935 [Candidatus Saccharibacteria bacterium]|nr:hypothetical protein [Candidatus Saccharibacteria bacterium]